MGDGDRHRSSGYSAGTVCRLVSLRDVITFGRSFLSIIVTLKVVMNEKRPPEKSGG